MRYDPEVIRCFVEIIEEEIRAGVDSSSQRFAMHASFSLGRLLTIFSAARGRAEGLGLTSHRLPG